MANTQGPIWVHAHHVRPVSSIPNDLQPVHVQPGRVWSDDPTLDTFRALEN